jgi:hypothetical protein
MPAEWNGQHAKSRVETERKVACTCTTEPEMLAPVEFSPIAIEIGVKVGRAGFCKKQLAFPQRSEGNGAGGVSTFMEHGTLPVFLS